MLFYLTAAESELPKLDPRLLVAAVDYHSGRAFPEALPPHPEGVLMLGGPLHASQAADLAAECRRRSFRAVLAGFGSAGAVETLRFCDGLLRLGVTPILTEACWREGCGAELMISSAVSGGSLRTRLEEALRRCPDLSLDLERLCRSFPLPCPDGEGEPLPRRELERLLRAGAKPAFSEELMCKAFSAECGGEMRFILFDDRESLCRKALLAAEMGVCRAFLLYPEWSAEDAAAALNAVSP